MRKYLLAGALFVSTLSVQTTVVAQPGPEPGSRAYCEARWARIVSSGATGGQTEGAFVDKCMSCDAKFKEMVASGQSNGDRSAFMRRCSGGGWSEGYGVTGAVVTLGILGGVGYALSQPHGDKDADDQPVSPE
jgi:hypothetical protein